MTCFSFFFRATVAIHVYLNVKPCNPLLLFKMKYLVLNFEADFEKPKSKEEWGGDGVVMRLAKLLRHLFADNRTYYCFGKINSLIQFSSMRINKNDRAQCRMLVLGAGT